MRPSIFGAVLILPFAAACGGYASVDLDGGSDAGGDAKGDVITGDGGACVPAPKQGTACTPGQVACDKVIGCCSPVYGCNPTTKTWEIVPTGCPCASFNCGTTTCLGNQVCKKQYGGVPMPDGGVSVSYSCVAYPAACERQQTCDCLKESPPPGCTLQPTNGCEGTATGNTVSCMGQ